MESSSPSRPKRVPVGGLGSAWLETHGHGMVPAEKQEALATSLKQELVGKGYPSEKVQKEIDRFLQVGRASATNFDRLQRRIDHVANGGAASQFGSASAFSCGASEMDKVSLSPSLKKSSLAAVSENGVTSPKKVHYVGVAVPLTPRRSPQTPRKTSTTQAAESLLAPKSSPKQQQSLNLEAVSETEPLISPRLMDVPDYGEKAKWSNIAKLQKKMLEEETAKKKEAERLRKAEYMEVLMKQMEDKKFKKKLVDDEKVVKRAEVDEDKEKYVQEEAAKKQKQQEYSLRVKEDIQGQREFRTALLKKEAADSLAVGQELVRAAIKDLETEQQAKAEKLAAQRVEEAKQSRIWEEEKQKRLAQKEIERHNILLERKKLEAELAAEAEKQEEIKKIQLEERNQQFQELELNQQKARNEAMSKRTARLEEEAAALEVVRRLAAEAEQKEKDKQERHRQALKANQNFLIGQMQEKRKVQDVYLVKEKQMQSATEEARRAHVEAEKQKVIKQQRKRNDYQKDLVAQITLKKEAAVEGSKKKEDLLSSVEMSMNREVLDRVVSASIA
eukprot:TRINITY_DN13122_c2_g1_i1.p1 TRINITY_DN13122_c2_g1~~TRINITY_DN13122_c2_g1_i1.p1  ORF type:complete len:583 (-),score=163.93 TRINITY_DN13122_c2_g1_i1:104-1783(-)